MTLNSTGRWRPSSETDIRSAAADGRLEETHWCELKAQIKPGPSGNRELARDLACFAVDGGMLILGLGEPASDGDPLRCDPIPLDGIAEKIESIARSIPDPPLPVISHLIRSDHDPSTGWVVVDIPSSGAAPHLVDGVAYARGDKQRIRLTAEQIRSLHDARAATASVLEAVLADMVERDPVPHEQRLHAHLFLAAEPLFASDDTAIAYVEGEWHAKVTTLIRSAMALPQDGLRGQRFAPDLDYAVQPYRRADGVAMVDPCMLADRTLDHTSSGALIEDFLEIVISDRGGIRIGNGRFSDLRGRFEGQVDVLIDGMAPVLTRRLLHMAAQLGRDVGYSGPWAIGIQATGLEGVVASSLSMMIGAPTARYDRNVYRAITTATINEIVTTPGAVTGRLVNRLLRALGVAHVHAGLTSDG